jgi:hypothetical protein
LQDELTIAADRIQLGLGDLRVTGDRQVIVAVEPNVVVARDPSVGDKLAAPLVAQTRRKLRVDALLQTSGKLGPMSGNGRGRSVKDFHGAPENCCALIEDRNDLLRRSPPVRLDRGYVFLFLSFAT